MKLFLFKSHRDHEEDLRDSAAATVAIVSRREHHVARVIAPPLTSNDNFIDKPLVLIARARPESNRAVNIAIRRLTFCFIER